MSQISWQAIRGEVERRVSTGIWRPGDTIPSEAALAEEFACARATVNRALRSLAEDGMVERRRRTGTRIAPLPSPKARIPVPLLRAEVEATGAAYTYRLLRRRLAAPPALVAQRIGLRGRLVNLRALPLAGAKPYCLEERWLNPEAVPGLLDVDFATVSANEYLLAHVPLSKGTLALSAAPAGAAEAKALATGIGKPLFEMIRTTWSGTCPVTTVRLLFPPGYRLETVV